MESSVSNHQVEDDDVSTAFTDGESEHQQEIEHETVGPPVALAVSDIHSRQSKELAPVNSMMSDKIGIETMSSHSLLETNVVMHCIYGNNLERLQNYFQNESDHHKKEILNSLHERDLSGKSPLDIASSLGRVEIVQFLISTGAEKNGTSSKGYTSLHYAAAWGRKAVLKAFVDSGANFLMRNTFGERPRDVAQRYNQTECVYYLDWAEAKMKLEEAVSTALELINEQPDKNSTVKFTKEEKYIVVNTCKEKQEWMDKNIEPTIQDYEMHLTSFLNIVQPILLKLTEQGTNSLGIERLAKIMIDVPVQHVVKDTPAPPVQPA